VPRIRQGRKRHPERPRSLTHARQAIAEKVMVNCPLPKIPRGRGIVRGVSALATGGDCRK
jgi:hypothetical protein